MQMQPWLALILLIGWFSPTSWAATAKQALQNDTQWIGEQAGANRFEAIQLKIAAAPYLKAVMVWSDSNSPIFPPIDAMAVPQSSRYLTPHTPPLIANSDAGFAWEASDLRITTGIACTLSINLKTCVEFDIDKLSETVGEPTAQIRQVLRSTASPASQGNSAFLGINTSTLLVAALGLAALLLSPMLLKRWASASTASRPKHIQKEAPKETAGTATVVTDEAAFWLGDMQIDPKRMRVLRDSHQADISPRDLKLLRYFACHPDEVISKSRLYDAGWGRDFLPNSRSLEQHIATLRKKIDPSKQRPALIVTVHGQGYRHPKHELTL